MARKNTTVTLNDRGCDKTFYIEEMSARKTQSWLGRAILLLTGSGADVPDIRTVKTKDAMAVFLLRALSGLEYGRAEALMDELLLCCSHVHADGKRVQMNAATVDGVIEDVGTLFNLQLEAVKLHFDFFTGMLPSGWKEKLKAKVEDTFNTSILNPSSE